MKSEQQQPQAGFGKLGLCSGCSYFPGHLNAHLCTPGDACIRAHSGRQIDRFLRQNRDEAEKYLKDIFWERRAIAARYAAVDRIFDPISDLAACPAVAACADRAAAGADAGRRAPIARSRE